MHGKCFTLCKVCFPERIVCLLHNTGWFFLTQQKQEVAFFPPTNQSQISWIRSQSCTGGLSISLAMLLSLIVSLSQLADSAWQYLSSAHPPPSLSCSTAEGAHRPAEAWVADWGLRLQLACANHVDYCDYRPFPPSVTLQLTDLNLAKVPLAIGNLSSCSAPSKS